ncbi:SDR family oxidoreductase [Streptomyces sp. NPDC048718]|uniref:SDR family oxidoreductase n=1 Tax=Streptomyces sp. NPDC048718 TaxID=3365587 RepID=UPI0037229B79
MRRTAPRSFSCSSSCRRCGTGGSTVDIGSGVTRIALADEPAYAMTKGVRETFTRTLANVVGGRRITVDTVVPGPTETAGLTARPAASPEPERMPLAGQALPWVGQLEGIADPGAFLASPDGRWITGTVIQRLGRYISGAQVLTSPYANGMTGHPHDDGLEGGPKIGPGSSRRADPGVAPE